MKRVLQTKLGPKGNCLNACVSMITNIPLEEIPEFKYEENTWLVELKEWLEKKGYVLTMLGHEKGSAYTVNAKFAKDYIDVPVIATGHTKKGSKILHAVVFYKNECFDPHPTIPE